VSSIKWMTGVLVMALAAAQGAAQTPPRAETETRVEPLIAKDSTPAAKAEPAPAAKAEAAPTAKAEAAEAEAAPAAIQPAPRRAGMDRFAGMERARGTQTVITSERIEFDYKEMVAVFDENVRVENPQFLMLADRVLVFLDGTNDVRQILAIGRVSVTNELRSASCDRAVYTRAAEQIVLTGNAHLRRGADFVRGDRIDIWLNDERMEVSPGTFVIAPGTIKERREEEDPEKPE